MDTPPAIIMHTHPATTTDTRALTTDTPLPIITDTDALTTDTPPPIITDTRAPIITDIQAELITATRPVSTDTGL
jgi:hypothetical protein